MQNASRGRGIHSARPYFSENDRRFILAGVDEILSSGRLIQGKYVGALEKAFAEYIGTKYAVAVSSCTAALEISMRYFGVSGARVSVPTNTFIACPNSVLFAGGRPVFADINEDTYAVDLASVEESISPETRGVMLVHLGGLPILDTVEIRTLCHEKGLFLIEDCSHSHGASIGARKVGSFGDAGCFSLMATKVMTSGLGGILTTNSRALHDFATKVRDSATGRKPVSENLASDWLMSEMAAVVGVSQLRSLEAFLVKRNEIARAYADSLRSVGTVKYFSPPKGVRSSYYKFLAGLLRGNKARLIARASSKGVELGSLYEVPCNLQPIYTKMGYGAGNCPVAEDVLKRQVALPLHVSLNQSDIDTVVGLLRAES